MIQILGVKRIIVLLVLVGVNALLAAATYLYIVPQHTGLERDLRTTRAQISSKRSEADTLRTEYQLIQKQKTQFEDLEKAGFMTDQNRLEARRRIVEIQKYTKVLQADYSISPAAISEDENSKEASHVILTSPMSFDIEAMDDIDMYEFIYWMENAFPGHTAMTSMRVERVVDVNDVTLLQLGTGRTFPLIKGSVNFEWKTMVPKTQISGGDDNQFNYDEF